MEISAGSRVDRYILEALLGEGGQGSVWRAQDRLVGGQARALKLVPVSAARPTDLERVRREARKLAQLEHPSLVVCHGLFEDLKLGVLGVAMDLVDGPNVAQVLGDPDFSPFHRVALLSHVAELLEFVHSRGIVHRDLKPENVLLAGAFLDNPEDPANVKVVDFGIAHLEGEEGLTQADHVMGTASYLAPEQLLPAFFGHGIPRTAADVFAYGVMAQVLLTGTHPTGLPRGSPVTEFALEYRRVAEGNHVWPKEIPEGPWGVLVRDCLAVRGELRLSEGRSLAERVRVARTNIPRLALPSRSSTSAAPPGDSGARALLGTARTVENSEPVPAFSSERSMDAVSRGATPAWNPRASLATPAERVRAALASAPEPSLEAPAVGVRARPRPSLMSLGFGLVGLSAIGIGWVFWSEIALLAGLSATSPRLPKPGTSGAAGLQGGVPRIPPPSSTARPVPPEGVPDAAADPASDGAAAASLPGTCGASTGVCGCCPTQRDCGPGACSDPLGAEERFTVRLLDIQQKTQSARNKYPTYTVCVGKGGTNPGPSSVSAESACFRVGELHSVPARAPGGAWVVTSAELANRGLDVRVYEPSNPVPVADTLYRRLIGLSRLTLCQGLSVDLTDGDGSVDRVLFALDEPDAPPKERCP